MGEFGKSGELGENGKLGTESGAERRTRFLRGEGERLCEMCVCGGGVLGGGSCRKGNLWSRHDREGEVGHAGKGICGVGMTGKARWVMPEREFAGVGMTGKARWVMPERKFAGVGMTGEPLAPA